jgi:hypothetical protein
VRDRRTLDEIADEAVAEINPPAESKEACRALVMDCLEAISRMRIHPMKTSNMIATSMAGYAKALRAARAKAAAAYATFSLPYHFFDEHGDGALNFIDLLDDELKNVEDLLEVYGSSKSKGRPLRDLRANVAAEAARDLIDHDCPWRRKPTLTAKGPWLRLSSLLYEALTGEYDRDLLRYCRRLAKAGPVKTTMSHLGTSIDITDLNDRFRRAAYARGKFYLR